jgi:signal-induced proliferation-associated 1 like protein 3
VPLVPPMLPPVALPALPELVEPLLLDPELLCFFVCFFLLDLWVDEVPVLWSCGVALVVSPVEELPLVCAWAFTVPNIAMATDAPSRPFSSLFIFMSLS